MSYFTFLHRNWMYLFAGFLLTFTSSYGQTYFISLFAGEIKTDFDLTDGEWGGIYTLGTALSAVAMIWAGVLTDRFRIRTLAIGVMIALALACCAMAASASPLVLIAVVFALRFTGQGMMSQLGSVAMVRWFDASRGKALSVVSLGFSTGQAILPIAFVALLAAVSWRSLWVVAAVLVLVTIPAITALLRQERTPQSMAEADRRTGMDGVDWTRGQALRSGLFYLMIPTTLGPAAWGTALFFHQVHLTEVKGWELIDYVALMPIYTVAAVAMTFASGWAIDRFGVSRIVQYQMLPFVISFTILAYADSIFVAGVALIVFGLGQGLLSTTTAAFWSVYFGTKHIGAIKAVVAAVMVFGSAIGPGITGAFIDLGYDFPSQLLPIASFYILATCLSWIGIERYRPRIAN